MVVPVAVGGAVRIVQALPAAAFGVGGAMAQLKWTVIHHAVGPAAEGVVAEAGRGGAVVVGEEIARLVVAEADRLFRGSSPRRAVMLDPDQLVGRIVFVHSPLPLGLDLLHQVAHLVVRVARGLAHGPDLLHQLVSEVILEAGALALGVCQADQVAPGIVLVLRDTPGRIENYELVTLCSMVT